MGKSFAEKLPAFLRTYKTEKFIRVDVPRVGIFFRVCQFFAFLLVLAQLYLNDGWALSEVPGGISNAWDEPGTMMSSTNDVHAKRAATEYCSNASYSYSSEGYSYVAPQCEALLPAELTSKTSNTVFYTTAYIETVTRGWACSSATAAAQRTTCQSGGGVFYERLTGQCGCVTQRAVYPLAVEEMGLAFEHSYDTSEKVGFRGSSASSEGNPDDAMYSMVFFPNGSTTRFEAGEVVRLPLTEWIAAANITLKGRNDKVNPDPTGVLPPKRTTGLLIKVDIQYTNADRNSRRAVPGKRQVHADVTLRAEEGTWTGTGVQTIWVQFPTLPRDTPQDFHLVERWRQGVLFQFATSGRIYKFDVFYLMSVVISGLVLLKMANAATNLYAFNCLGAESVILRNKRIELASKKSEFAEIGMKAALAAATYPKFDRFCDGSIEAEDIARAFANVEGVSWEVGYMIAKNILSDADTEPSLPGEVPGLNYIEFMTCLEGDAINFEEYLKDTRKMFDEHMAADEARDAKAGKKSDNKKELTAKEKAKVAKELALKKAKERQEQLDAVEKSVKESAKAAGLDLDDYIKEVEDKEDDAMRERCKKAFEEEKAAIAARAPEDSGDRKKKPPKKEDGEEGGGEEAVGITAAAPEPGPSLELSDDAKAERLGKCGKLTVKLACASNLKSADKDGLSDPYVEVKLGKKAKKSKPCSKTLSPQWDEDLELATKLSLKKVCKDGLTVLIQDKDTGMMDSDDVIGKLTASLAALETCAKIEFAEAIPEGGVLKFSVEWEEGETVEKKAAKKEKDVSQTV